MRMKVGSLILFLFATTSIVFSTGTSQGQAPDQIQSASVPTQIEVQTPRQLTNVSADDYSHNRWGLIEASTLEAFIDNWSRVDSASQNQQANGRPAHVSNDARLIILQLNGANRATGENYIPASPEKNVLVFQLDNFRFNEARDTGLISDSVRYQASGPTTDAWLERYGVNLERDYLVFAAGENTGNNGGFFQDLGRAIYWLSYWGADIKNLALVNGTLKQNYRGALVSSALPQNSLSNDGFSVRNIRRDATSLTVPFEDVLAVVDSGLSASGIIQGFEQQIIIDARPTSQFLRTATNASFYQTHPGQFITTGWNSAGGPSQDETGREKNYVLVEGNIKGATSFPWASLLVDTGDNNWKYRPKAELTTIFEAAGYGPSRALDTVIISQCRTNFEVQVNGFASRVILGYPTVHFDGSLIEYTSLVSTHPNSDFNLKPTDPAYQYRTDVPSRFQFYTPSGNAQAPTIQWDDSGVAAYNVPGQSDLGQRKVSQARINRNATTTRKAIHEDQAYKTNL